MLAGCQRPAAARGGVGLADIFRAYGESYRRSHSLPVLHLRVMRAIERCRTAALGGHMQKCDSCGFERPAYNSCRNRHCPKCQSLAKLKWLDKQKSELLPVGYFHLVFTLPHELNRLILANKKTLINILFQSVSKTLAKFAQSHLRGTLGIIAVLHTWDQTLLDHFHLHCLLPAGALSFDQSRWMSARQNFLFPVKALSVVFRAKFLDANALNHGGTITGKQIEYHQNVQVLRNGNVIRFFSSPLGLPDLLILFRRCFFVALRTFFVPRVFFRFFSFSLGMLLPPLLRFFYFHLRNQCESISLP
jgi:Transposase zinc-binding domain/Putative transposase